MPIFMDIHDDLGDVTEQDIQNAHEQDLAVQDRFGVRFLTYWFNNPDGQAFCLVEAPDAGTLVAAHKAAHGLAPHKVIEVDKPSVSQFMGNWERSAPNMARDSSGDADSGLRAIMFTDLAGSTQVSTRDGDASAMELIAGHDRIVRGALDETRGREVKHTGDGIFASFNHVSSAVGCALRIQHDFGEPKLNDGSDEGRLRIGISVGEPVSQNDDLFGAVVNLAARLCGHAQPGQILVSSAVRELSVGKPFAFVDQGSIALQGFDDPVKVFEVPTGAPA